ncbi:hypothetical protein ACIVBQ_000452 [Tenacibaculum discolor]
MKKIIFALFTIYSITLFSQDNYISKTRIKKTIELRKKPKLTSTGLNYNIKKGTNVNVLNFMSEYWLVKPFNDTIKGWVPSTYIHKTDTMYVLYNKYLKDKLYQKYSSEETYKIKNGIVWVGMTKEMLLECKGEPKDKNISNYENDIHEQWIYPNNKYIYLVNNIVTAIQNI